jgi:16S rRNA G1207 methylase RsmC
VVSNEHYFSKAPAGERKLKEVSYSVGGREITARASTGTFSSGGLDLFPKSGNVLDLGCGWGPIALAIATICPDSKVWAIDVNARSVELTQQNAENLGLKNVESLLADALPADLKLQEIWSNPPIRIGKAELHELLRKYLGRLLPGGRAMLVVQKQLGAESLMKWLSEEFANCSVNKAHADKGYWVIELISPTDQ